MHTLAPKQKPTQETGHIKKHENDSRTSSRQTADINSLLQLQNSIGNRAVQRMLQNGETVLPDHQATVQKRKNNTGLPDGLKNGVEHLSGYSMDDVKVHYNSNKPAQLNALAYTQGTEIHVAPDQEKHLPHEAWHVVQQKQGRVKPTMQMKGTDINDEVGLEKEADVMGEKSQSIRSNLQELNIAPMGLLQPSVIQRQGATGTLETIWGIEEIEGVTITGSGVNYVDNVVSSLNAAMNRAFILANSYAIEVINACSDFENYAESKVEALEGEVTGAEFAAVLAGGVVTLAAGPLVGRVTSVIGEKVAGVIASAITSKIKEKVKEASSNSDDASELRRAIKLITQGARDASTISRNEIFSVLDPEITRIQTKLNVGDQLSDEENELVGVFFSLPSGQITENVVSYFGIPDGSRASEIRIQIYRRLVEDFEELYFKATSTLRDSLYYSLIATSRSGAREYAFRVAKREAAVRRRAIIE